MITLYGIQYFMDKNNRLNHFKLYFICTLVAVFSQVVLKNDQWLSVLPVIGDKNQYFIATKTG
jgi:hypothetical protein